MSLRALGYDEYWLQDRLAETPTLLGLGPTSLVTQEAPQTAGGSLDLLLSSGGTLYSVEVQLGPVDPSHAFRTLEYWLRNRARWPDRRHVAVIVAESVNARYGRALQALSEDLPIVVIELSAKHEDDGVELTTAIVAAHESLGLTVTARSGVLTDRTRQSWEAKANPEALQTLNEFFGLIDGFGVPYVDYSSVSYIGVRRGRSLWAKVRLTRSGITVNLPNPDGGRVLGSPTRSYEGVRGAAAQVGVSMKWQPSSGNGAHPVALFLRPGDAVLGEVEWAARTCWDALDADPLEPGVWSEDRDDWDANELTGFSPHYWIDTAEVGYGRTVDATSIQFSRTMDDSHTLWSVADDKWDDREFARRVLLDHTKREPTKRAVSLFLAGPAAGAIPRSCGWC